MPQVLDFECPHCRGRLRSKDRTLVGREIPCPHCAQPIRIVDRPDGRVEADAIARLSGAEPAKAIPRGPSRWTVRVAVTSTVLLCCGLLFFVLRETGPSTDGKGVGAVVPVPAVGPMPPNAPPIPPGPDEPPPTEPVAAERLRQLGEWIEADRLREGAWPLAVDGDDALDLPDRFSWLARLARTQVNDGTPPPTLSLPWNAPENDRFVRRRLAPFQVPELAPAGDDRYPARHFVGVAGVGADAPGLPKSHPRAGIWGYARRTTVEDVKDGLTNTFLVMGQERGLHSWANGEQSIRGLTAEPYFQGPDGFGTGQPEGMHVLMADGSVRFLSRSTDPVVMRRHAAMSDGLPLDPAVPGDPLRMEPGTPASPPPSSPAGPITDAQPPARDEMPILPELAVDLPTVDIERALGLPLKQYRVQNPVAIQEILFELRELTAVPLDWSAFPQTADGPLAATMTMNLEGTTVGGVLEVVAERLGAEIVRERLGIRLIPRKEKP